MHRTLESNLHFEIRRLEGEIQMVEYNTRQAERALAACPTSQPRQLAAPFMNKKAHPRLSEQQRMLLEAGERYQLECSDLAVEAKIKAEIKAELARLKEERDVESAKTDADQDDDGEGGQLERRDKDTAGEGGRLQRRDTDTDGEGGRLQRSSSLLSGFRKLMTPMGSSKKLLNAQ